MEGLYRLITSLIPVKCEDKNGEVLFHASSIGEINAIYPLIRRFKSHKVSVFTKWGYDYAKELGLNAFRFPFDNPRCLKKVLRDVKLVVIAETEIWPNLINLSKSLNIPVFIVNGTISPGSYKLYKMFPIFRKAVSRVDMIICQSSADADRFRELGAKNTLVMGNLKFDSVERPVKDIKLKNFKVEGSFLFANIRGREIKTVVESIVKVSKHLPDTRFIIAPRHLENIGKISSMLGEFGVSHSLRTDDGDTMVLILNTLGELWSIYRFCKACFVGGTLWNYGGHSLIEPAYWKLPIICGEHLYKQPYAWYMVKEGIVRIVKNSDEIADFIVKIYTDENFHRDLSERVFEFYLRNKGISEKVYKILLSALK
ncbi:MAG: glycosyltransferase N-terminal domain-containing protein [candidate division WOR-3 bacterium]